MGFICTRTAGRRAPMHPAVWALGTVALSVLASLATAHWYVNRRAVAIWRAGMEDREQVRSDAEARASR